MSTRQEVSINQVIYQGLTRCLVSPFLWMPIKAKSHEQRMAELRGQQLRAESDKRYLSERNPLVTKVHRSRKWTDLSKRVRREDPLCRDPFLIHKRRGIYAETKHVHHIKKIETHPDLAYVRSNLIALCEACHSEIEEQPDYIIPLECLIPRTSIASGCSES